ncbi:MAG: hypothetical protein HY326_14700, partial [Chloroflexi bacterium]|nr:hypothetical protein [Chloroflexota bacterium]
ILGLAFKPNTSVITESPALKLIAELVQRHIRLIVYDPLAIDRTKVIFGDQIAYGVSPEQCLSEAGLAVVTLRYPALKQAVESYVPAQPLTLIDCWRLIDPQQLPTSIRYVAIGKSVA